MNKIILTGILVRDVEVKYTQTNKCVAKFTLAVRKRFKKEGEPDADFISCAAWGKTAELIGNYLHKGSKAGIVGQLTTRTYEKDGQKKYITEVLVDEVEFLSSKNEAGNSNQQFNGQSANEEDVPF